jgi:hypothetical protein
MRHFLVVYLCIHPVSRFSSLSVSVASIRCLTVCACACISFVPRSLSLSLSVCVRLCASAVWQACFAGAIFKSGAYVFFVGVALQYSETYSRCSYIRFARETLMNPASLFPRARRVLRLVDGIPRLLPPSSFLLPPSSFLLPPSSFLLPPSSEGRVCLESDLNMSRGKGVKKKLCTTSRQRR